MTRRWPGFDLLVGQKKNGSIFDFVMQTEGSGFRESGRAAGPAGRHAAAASVPRGGRARAAPQDACMTCSRLAAKFFEATLAGALRRQGTRLPGGSWPRSRHPRSGFSAWAMRPSSVFALKEHLGRARPSRSRTWWRRGCWWPATTSRCRTIGFRDRVIFPIGDLRGRVVAFGGRALDKEAQAQISQLAGDARSSTRAARSTTSRTAAARCRPQGARR